MAVSDHPGRRDGSTPNWRHHLDEDGKGPGVIENPLVRGAQARAYDTRELHAAEKRVEDRVRADEVYPVDGWALVCNHVLGMADWSGIHNINSVYYTP